MQDYRRLTVWKAARDMTLDLYAMTEDFPRSERYGLTQQLRRSSISISSSIAEGCGRGSQRELLRFLKIASGSAHELESQLLVAIGLGFCQQISAAPIQREVREIKSMLAGLQRSVRASIH